MIQGRQNPYSCPPIGDKSQMAISPIPVKLEDRSGNCVDHVAPTNRLPSNCSSGTKAVSRSRYQGGIFSPATPGMAAKQKGNIAEACLKSAKSCVACILV